MTRLRMWITTAVALAMLTTGVGGQEYYRAITGGTGLFASGTQLAPGITFAAFPQLGFWAPNNFTMVLVRNNVNSMSFIAGGSPLLTLNSASVLSFTSTADSQGTNDLGLSRTAANTLAIGNGAQGSTTGTVALTGLQYTTTLFASLGTPANGTVFYCSDCLANSTPCTGASTGAMAKRLNGVWDCR